MTDTQRTCSIEGCDSPRKARGWCDRHWQRWHAHGSPEAPGVQQRGVVAQCQVDTCSDDHYCRGWCVTHYLRWRRHGDPEAVVAVEDRTVPDRRGANGPAWSGELVGYPGAHRRVVALRDRASTHACAHCGGTAREWAYDHDDPSEKRAEYRGALRPWSTDPAHYLPLCVPCHRRFDANPYQLRLDLA